MEESNGNIESPHLFVRWLRVRRRRLWLALQRLPAWKGRLVAILGPLVALVGFFAALIGIRDWWRDRPPPLPDLRIVERFIDEPVPVGSTKEPELCRSEPATSLTGSSPSY